MKRKIGDIVWWYRSTFKTIQREMKSNLKIPLLQRFRLLLNGFNSDKYNLYNLKKNNKNDYLSDYQQILTQRINKKYSVILNDKLVFEQILSGSGLTPKVYGGITKGNLFISNQKASFNDFLRLLKNTKRLMIKSRSGSSGGKGVFKIAYLDKKIHIDDIVFSAQESRSFIENLEDSIITEFIQQANYSHNIFPGSVNTMRILTMINPDSGEPFIAAAVHKFGSEKTAPVDNVWAGGLTSLINLETGVLNQPVLHSENNSKIKKVSLHPDTKEPIEGIQIPNWVNIKNQVLSLSAQLNFLNYVGWDVVALEDGIKIIEGNSTSDVNILQIHEPLLKEKRIKDFYKYHHVL